eukprot:GHRR01014111.1.p1 GENE.GHRR01014111.1~~GHRR01014111.1.p1  ORF type:complete len:272 (+),score=72.18 GHRR01014111.1:539-1354(+)
MLVQHPVANERSSSAPRFEHKKYFSSCNLSRTRSSAVRMAAVQTRVVVRAALSTGILSDAQMGAASQRGDPAEIAMANAGSSSKKDKTSVLFVCLGNICRSPTAEAMFRAVVEKAGVTDQFDIDSCGTGGGSPNWYMLGGFSYHEGDESDPRMTAAGSRRGVCLTSRSRPLNRADLSRFDYIIGMDPRNVRDILKAAGYWANADKQLPTLDKVRGKISLMTQYCTKYRVADEVPDPYYGGPAGFERVLDLLDDAATGLFNHIQIQLQQQRQ